MDGAALSNAARAIGAPRPGMEIAAAAAKDPAKIKAAADDFEAVFLTNVFQTMFAGLQGDGPLGGGEGAEVYRSLLADEYGKAVSAAGGVGLSEAIQRELVNLQANANKG